jgi:raffinose/stachyose/melibiose transport system permease protein
MAISSKNKQQKIFVGIFLFLASLVIMIPFYFAIVNSLKTPTEVIDLSFKLPKKLIFDNYVKVFNEGHVLRGLMNSISIAIPSVVFQLLLASLTAFILQRRGTRGSIGIYNYVVFGLIPSGFLIPTVMILKYIHLLGTKPGLLLIYIGGGMPFMVLLFAGFMKNIPKEIDESAIVEGCKLPRMFFTVIFPQLLPILMTGLIISFMGTWNDFASPLYYLNKPSKFTLPLSVYNFVSMYETRWELVYADLIMIALPIVILYLSVQKYIIEGMSAGAVKG